MMVRMDDQYRILDGHAHAFPDAIAAGAIEVLTAEALWMPVKAHHDGTIKGLLGQMDEAGIERAIMCSVATKPAQTRKITDWSASIDNPRIIPFASIHPDYEQPEREIERIATLGIRGLKFHSYYMNCPIDDPRAVRIAKAAAEAGLAMAFHTGYDLGFEKVDICGPTRVRALHEAVPDLRMQACHMGSWQDWQRSLEHVAGLPIYIETSFSLGQCPDDLLLEIIDRHGRDYFMFGTDSPWASQSDELARFQALPIDPTVMRQALWDNGHRFVGLA
jgi:hypothetical protein